MKAARSAGTEPDLRQLQQPGPVAPERFESVAAAGRVLDFTLEPGLTLNAAVAAPLRAAGFTAAAVTFAGGTLAPFSFVMPAAAPDASHAAWYSATFSPPGETRVEMANATFGSRDGAPFIHCHAFWRTADGTLSGGHILPLDTVVASPMRARAWGSAQAAITVRPDPETNFSLFAPEPAPPRPAAAGDMLFARLRPNMDICAALEAVCRRHGVARARICGSIGSIVGARFEDADPLDDFATEFLVEEGEVAPDSSGTPRARLKIAIVGLSGALRRGWLVPGRNAVCITAEVALMPWDGESAPRQGYTPT